MQPIRNHCKEPSTPSTLTQQCWASHYRAKDSVPRRVRTSALLCCCGKIKGRAIADPAFFMPTLLQPTSQS